MSLETEVMKEVRGLTENIKYTIMQNLVKAVRTNKFTLEDNKLPGLDRIIRDAVDQSLSNSTTGIIKAISKEK